MISMIFHYFSTIFTMEMSIYYGVFHDFPWVFPPWNAQLWKARTRLGSDRAPMGARAALAFAAAVSK